MSTGLGPEWEPVREVTQEEYDRLQAQIIQAMPPPKPKKQLGKEWVAMGPPMLDERKAELNDLAKKMANAPPMAIVGRAAATQVDPWERAEFEQMLYEHAKAAKPNAKMSFKQKSMNRILLGIEEMGEEVAEFVVPEMELDDRDELFRQRINAIKEGADPFSGKDAPWYKTGYYEALHQAPKMGVAIAAGSAAGAGAAAEGLGSLGVWAAESAGVGATYYKQMRDDTYYELLKEGDIPPEVASKYAAGSALLQSIIEGGIIANPFAKRMGSKAVSRTVRDIILSNMKRFGGEWSEEFAQSLVDETAQAIATGDKSAEEVLKTTLKEGLDALPTLAYLVGPGMVVGGTAEASQLQAQRQQRVADIQRWIETGYIPAEVGKELGIQGDTRAKRMADAKAQLEDAERRVERAKKIPRDQEVAEETGEVRQRGEADRRGDIQQVPEAGPEARDTEVQPQVIPPGGQPTQAGPPPVQHREGPGGVVPVSQTARGGKAKSTGEVVTRLSELFGFPIRTGHFRGGPKGIYKEKEGVARTKIQGDMAAASHEIAHGIDQRERPLAWMPAVLEPELGKLDYDYPDRADIHEGFAEYVRLRLTTGDAPKAAPNFDKWFDQWLDQNPEIKEQFAEAKREIGHWRAVSPIARGRAQIHRDVSKWRKVGQALKPRNVADWVQSNWINRLRPLFNAAREMTGARSQAALMDTMPADLNFWAFAKASNISASAKAREWAQHGTADVAGNRVGPGLKETFGPIAEELTDPDTLEQFETYAYARHALTLYDRYDAELQQWQGQYGPEPRLREPGISREDARAIVAELDSPEWRTAAEGLTSWHNDLVNYLVDAGGLSQEAATAMQDMYPNYISLSRHIDQQTQQGGGGGRLANQPRVVHTLKGSGRQIMPPLESALGHAERIIGVADKIRVGKMLVEASERYGMLGEMVELVDPKDVAQSTRLGNLKRQLESAGADLSQADMDALLTVFSQDFTGDAKDNILVFYEDGKPQMYYVRPDLYRALMAVDKPARLPPIVDQTFGRTARAVRLGTTGLKPGFSLLTNPMRDIGTATMQTEYQRRNPFSIALRAGQGMVEEVTNTEAAQIWKRGGGPMAQPLGIDRKFLKEAVQELMAQSPKAKTLNWAKHPVDSLRNVFSIPEGGPRLAEFRAALEAEGWKPGQNVTFEQYVKAQIAAANVTVDFREAGWMGQWINQINPFFNATIQGPHRMASAIRNHPEAAIASGLLSLTLPTLALWWRQKDEEWYKDLSPMERYRYWHLRIPKTDTVLRIPKPFEWGHIFSSMPEALAQSIYDENPEALGEAFGTMMEDATPFEMTEMPPFIPGAGLLQPPMEVAANRSRFFDRPLVSKGQERLLPKDQYAPYTTETAKAIAAIIAKGQEKLGGEGRGISPIYMEHLASGWTGGLATQAVGAIESLAGMSGKKTGRSITGGPSTLPVVGRLFTSPLHTRQFDDFYTRLEHLEQKHASLKAKDKSDPSITMLKFMRDRVTDLAELRNESRAVLADESLTDDQKRDKFINIHLQMVNMAKEANDMAKLERPRTPEAMKEKWQEIHAGYAQETIYNSAKGPPEEGYYKGRPEDFKKAQAKYKATRELEKHRAMAVADTHLKAQQMLWQQAKKNNTKPATWEKRATALAELYGKTVADVKKMKEDGTLQQSPWEK